MRQLFGPLDDQAAEREFRDYVFWRRGLNFATGFEREPHEDPQSVFNYRLPREVLVRGDDGYKRKPFRPYLIPSEGIWVGDSKSWKDMMEVFRTCKELTFDIEWNLSHSYTRKLNYYCCCAHY